MERLNASQLEIDLQAVGQISNAAQQGRQGACAERGHVSGCTTDSP